MIVEEAVHCVGPGGSMRTLYFALNFAANLKTAPKKQSLFQRKKIYTGFRRLNSK